MSLLDMLGPLGMIPDIIRGKDPKRALVENAAAVVAPTAFSKAPGLFSNVSATNQALIESAVQTPGYGHSSASPMGLMDMAKTAAGYGKQIGDAAGAANQVRGLLSPQQMAPQMPVQQQAHSDPIGQMLAQQQQVEEARRQALMQQRGLLYGRLA